MHVNQLFPAKTPGLVGLASLMALYSTLFAIEVGLWIISFFVISKMGRFPHLIIDSFQFKLMTVVFYCIVVVVIPVYFIFPQIALKRLVSQLKEKTLGDLEAILNIQLTADMLSSHNNDHNKTKKIHDIGNIYWICKQSPNHPLNSYQFIRAVCSIILGMVVAFLTSPDIALSILKNIQTYLFGH